MNKPLLYGGILVAIVLCSFAERFTEDSYRGFAYEKGNNTPVYAEEFMILSSMAVTQKLQHNIIIHRINS